MRPEAEAVACPTFEAVFEALEAGRVARAVVPIENSLFGSVHVNYDLLRRHDVRILAERQRRIRHHLMAPPGVRLADVRRVCSHPQALGQCQDFLRTHLPGAEAVAAYDTAGAAKQVAEAGARDTAAIASARAAATYGLDVLAAGIESNHRNFTRFLLLARAADAPPPAGPGPFKTSVVYALRRNVPGGLFKSLAVFALREIDLYKLESRPLVGHPGQYLFYCDCAGTAGDDAVQRALDHLGEIADPIQVLGSYPRCDEAAADGADG